MKPVVAGSRQRHHQIKAINLSKNSRRVTFRLIAARYRSVSCARTSSSRSGLIVRIFSLSPMTVSSDKLLCAHLCCRRTSPRISYNMSSMTESTHSCSSATSTEVSTVSYESSFSVVGGRPATSWGDGGRVGPTVWCSATVVKLTTETAILISHGQKSKFRDHSTLRLCIKEGPTIADMRGSQ